MCKKLYIIGNGFDLHHGLKTRYTNFADYVKEHNQPLYYLLESHFTYPKGETLWYRFEENLANLDVENVMSDNSDLEPDIASDDFHSSDMERLPDRTREIVELLTEHLLFDFKAFIRAVDFPSSVAEKKLKIDVTATFLNFNYTNTLESVYGIKSPQIIYIHNSADSYNNLVLGHGMDPKRFDEKLPEPPEDVSEENYKEWYEQNIDTYYPTAEGRSNLMEYFARSFKPTMEIIQHNKSFFKKLTHIRQVWVLGHSLSEVDLPYFQEVKMNISRCASWYVSYYDEREKERHLNTLVHLGIRKCRIKLFPLDEIQANNRQLKMDLKLSTKRIESIIRRLVGA